MRNELPFGKPCDVSFKIFTVFHRVFAAKEFYQSLCHCLSKSDTSIKMSISKKQSTFCRHSRKMCVRNDLVGFDFQTTINPIR